MRSHARGAHALPAVYLLAALALIAVLVPTTLRPPPTQPPSSAQLNPDEPPEDRADIVSNLGRASSTTAGGALVTGVGPPALVDVQPTPDPRPTRGRCVGVPPRQVESLYAASCVPAFTGPNGGATSRNVFAGEVRLAFYHSLDACDGPISETSPDRESGGHRTMRVLQAYVNQAYETYGRRVRFYCSAGGSKADAVKADDEWRVFAAANIEFSYCRELMRRGQAVFCDPPQREEMLSSRPLLWSWQMDRTSMQELGAEYYCRKLVGKPARFAGPGSGFRTQVRKLGVLVEQSPKTGLTSDPIVPALKAECGAAPADVIAFSASAAVEQVATAIARLKSQGVTTVTLNMDFFNYVSVLQSADAAAYYPEWLIFSPYGMDVNIVGNLMAQTQMTQVFGLSGWEWPRPTAESECYRAYKQIDPDNAPDNGACGTLWAPIVQLMNGIQGAGPKLTPQTWYDGLVRMGYRWYDHVPYAIGGGYGPADTTYIDDVGEIWWDPAAQKPEDETPGAYRWVRCGTRYRKGELPREDPLVFVDGGTGPGRNGCPAAQEGR